jgi:LmbE family N-acetylglucosaminyl deacetylase
MHKVLFISVHPDDETFGCGGTILRFINEGKEVYWLNITGISVEHPFGFSKEHVDFESRLVDKVGRMYGFKQVYNLKLPTMMLDTLPYSTLISKIDAVITEVKPDTLFLPNRSDVHSDHQVSFQASYACTKSFRKPYISSIFMYETLSETEFAPALSENSFIPNFYIDISDYWDKKIHMIRQYESEIMPDPLPRSFHAVMGIAAYRGSRIGAMYAEAHMLIYRKE